MRGVCLRVRERVLYFPPAQSHEQFQKLMVNSIE